MREPTQMHLHKKAACYLRQSTAGQVRNNRESTERQHKLAFRAELLGWSPGQIWVIDEDLGVSGGGSQQRPGFEKLAAAVLDGEVGMILYTEVSRVSRNDVDWSRLLKICGHLNVLLADECHLYDPTDPHDMVTLGILGSVSAFELTMIRERMSSGYWQKAQRGDLVTTLAPGYAWFDGKLLKHPNQEVREALETVFHQFDRLKSASKVQKWFLEAGLLLPDRPSKQNMDGFKWRAPSYDKIISILKNPVYSGTYVYGRSKTIAQIDKDGVVQTRKRDLAIDEWACVKKDQHDPYISWDHFMKNLTQLENNSSASRSKGSRQVHNGSGLLAGLVRCRRCGHKLKVRYHNSCYSVRYECNRGGKQRTGAVRCLVVLAQAVDETVAQGVCEVVRPAAIEQAIQAQNEIEKGGQHQLRLMLSRLEQLNFDESLARRRFEKVDPENRLVARNLEASWNTALEAVEQQKQLIDEFRAGQRPLSAAQIQKLGGLAKQFHRVWSSPALQDSERKELIASLVEEVVLDQDETTRETVALVHWKGGRHTEYRFPAGRAGRMNGPSGELKKIIDSLTAVLDDDCIATTLNRACLTSPVGMTWTTKRVQEFREEHKIKAFDCKEKCRLGLLTQAEAAAKLNVSAMNVFRLIERGILPADQLRRGFPRIIKEADLQLPAVTEALTQAPIAENTDLPLLELMQGDVSHG